MLDTHKAEIKKIEEGMRSKATEWRGREEAQKNQIIELSKEIKHKTAAEEAARKAAMLYMEKEDDNAMLVLCKTLGVSEDDKRRIRTARKAKSSGWF